MVPFQVGLLVLLVRMVIVRIRNKRVIFDDDVITTMKMTMVIMTMILMMITMCAGCVVDDADDTHDD